MSNDPKNPTPQQLLAALTLSWGADTVRKGDDWQEGVPSLNQCIPTALVVQYYFGGSICRAPMVIQFEPGFHYWNAFTEHGTIDFTGGQFVFLREWPNYKQMDVRDRVVLLRSAHVVRRYLILSTRVGVWLRWLCKDDAQEGL